MLFFSRTEGASKGLGGKRYLVALAALFMLAGCNSPAPQDMVLIPKGEFIMGSNEVDTDAKAVQYGDRKPWYANERPQMKITLPDYYIDKTEVTNKQYKEFVDSTGHRAPAGWGGPSYPPAIEQQPVAYVSWSDARDYCKWRKKRLPTEQEWEKAARGTDGRRFPWGNDFDIKKVNTLGEYGGPAPVGTFKDGASPYGLLDMAGNVEEWVEDWYKPYPGNDFNDKDYGEKFKVVRGGGWGGMGHYALQVYVRTSYRNIAPPDGFYNDVGLRCARSK